jgi:hypothetical protein
MKFGIITPVFDGCLDSLELLHGCSVKAVKGLLGV